MRNEETITGMKGCKITRRGFLIGLGAAGTGLVLGFPAARPVLAQDDAPVYEFGTDLSREPLVWFEILPEGPYPHPTGGDRPGHPHFHEPGRCR